MICSWPGFEKNQIQRMANPGECLKWISFILLKMKLINNNKSDLVSADRNGRLIFWQSGYFDFLGKKLEKRTIIFKNLNGRSRPQLYLVLCWGKNKIWNKMLTLWRLALAELQILQDREDLKFPVFLGDGFDRFRWFLVTNIEFLQSRNLNFPRQEAVRFPALEDWVVPMGHLYSLFHAF